MPIRITRDTIESVQIKVTDESGVTTTLTGTSPTFDVFRSDGTTAEVTAQSASATGMTIFCLLDTTGWNASETHFLLFVEFTVGSETPRLGPFDVYLV